MVTTANPETVPVEHESTKEQAARQLAERFTRHCFDDEGAITEQGVRLLNKLREVQFYLIGAPTQAEREAGVCPPGVITGHHVYGECCMVAANPDPEAETELMIIRRDTAVQDPSLSDHWLVARYQLNTGELEPVPVHEGYVKDAEGGADVSLLIPSRTTVEYQSYFASLWFHAVDGGYAEDGAKVQLAQYYGRTHRTIEDYSVDYGELRPAIEQQLVAANPRAFGVLSQPEPVTSEQFAPLVARESHEYEIAA